MSTPPPPELPHDPRSFSIPAPPPDEAGEPAPPDELSQVPAGPRVAPATTRGRRWPKVVALVLAGVALFTVMGLGYAWWNFGQIERVDLGDATGPGLAEGTNYLIVGSDSRDGVSPDDPNAGVIFGDVSGQRTDTIVVLHVGSDGNRMMALPRDLYLPIAETGREERINTAIQGENGPRRLTLTVRDSLGIPIHHYLEVDFAGFLGLVDAVGGITIDFPHPAYDDSSGLAVPEAGLQHLDPVQALAYVRSRHYVEEIDGVRVADPTSDLGRVSRQQQFLRAVFSKVGGTRNPIALNRVMGSMRSNLRIDDDLSFFEALGLGRKLGGLDPETVVLPVTNASIDGKSVLRLGPGADEALNRFR